MKVVENLWAVGAPPRTLLGAHSAPLDPDLMGRELLPLPKNPAPDLGLRPFGLDPQ